MMKYSLETLYVMMVMVLFLHLDVHEHRICSGNEVGCPCVWLIAWLLYSSLVFLCMIVSEYQMMVLLYNMCFCENV